MQADIDPVVSFSGGRSLAALTFMTAEVSLLDLGRGDIACLVA
ncbi:MAG: hypothetical protein OXH86_12035 [Acidimicrobiaceae bacterium]|nr:hypothetical protein [Acidimicrobiaceae bacterium]